MELCCFGTQALGWMGENEELAGWAQFFGAVLAMAFAYILPARAAKRAQAEASEQRNMRRLACALSAQIISINLMNAAERYAQRARSAQGEQRMALGREALIELTMLDHQMAALQPHELQNRDTIEAFRLARVHVASARYNYDHMAYEGSDQPTTEGGYQSLAVFEKHFEAAYLAFEAEAKRE